jgi:hypothetical protein
VLPDGASNFARDGPVAGIGKRANGLGKIGWNAGRDRHLAFGVYVAFVAHTLFFG